MTRLVSTLALMKFGQSSTSPRNVFRDESGQRRAKKKVIREWTFL